MFFFFQAEDGIRDLVRSRGLGDVYKRQTENQGMLEFRDLLQSVGGINRDTGTLAAQSFEDIRSPESLKPCLLYTSDAADERSSVDLGGRRIIKKKNIKKENLLLMTEHKNDNIKRKKRRTLE